MAIHRAFISLLNLYHFMGKFSRGKIDDIYFPYFLNFPEKRIWHFMKIVKDSLHEMSKPVFRGKKNKEKIFQYVTC